MNDAESFLEWNITRTRTSNPRVWKRTGIMTVQEIETIPRVHSKETDDTTLITMFQGGDDQAFARLVDRYTERVRNLVYSVLGPDALIDDIAQEVFIKVYGALPRFRFDAAFTTWLYRITVNRCRDEMRRRKVRNLISLDRLMERNDPSLSMHAQVQPVENEAGEIIQHALEKLSEKYRLPVILKDIEGCTYEEMAEIMNCEMGTVKSRLSRGRSMLREYLKPLLEM